MRTQDRLQDERLVAQEFGRGGQVASPFGLPHRLPDDGHVAGVCAGLARRLRVDVRAVRLLFVLLLLLTAVGAAAYLVLWLLMPPAGDTTVSFRGRHIILAAAFAVVVSGLLALLLG